jgi:GT2 family glycosyltransferase
MTCSPLVYVIVPTFKETELLGKLLKDLIAQDYKFFAIRVVNCNPGDKTTHAIRSMNDSRIREIVGHPDLFWTGAVELGQKAVEAEYSNGDFVLFLNSDTRVPPDHLSNQIAAATGRQKSLFCPITITPKRYISSGCKMRSWLFGIASHYCRGPIDGTQNFEDFISVDMLAGRALFAPASILKDIGFVATKKFPHYAADYEYTARAKRHGYQLFVATTYSIKNDVTNSGVKSDSPSVFSKRLEGLFSIKSPLNIKYRLRFVTSVYPWYAIPSAIFSNLVKIGFEVLIGNRLHNVFRRKL